MNEIKSLLPLVYTSEGVWEGRPQRPFKPSGLVIFDAPPGATVSWCTIGADLQAVVSCDPVPAKFFALGDSYAQLAQLISEGKEPPNWCTWDMIQLGMRVKLQLSIGRHPIAPPPVELQPVFWGIATA